MAIDIKTVDPAGLDGIVKARKPEGLFMALADRKLMFWRAVEVRNGRVSRNSGSFPEVLAWLFLRAKVLPRGREPKNRVVGALNPWRVRVQIPGKTAAETVPGRRAYRETTPEAVGENDRKPVIFHGGWGSNTLKRRPIRDEMDAEIPAGE